MGDARHRPDDRVRVSGRDRGDHAAGAGARVRLAVFPPGARRRPAAVAAPVLVFRPPGGLHHLPARGRPGVDDGARPGRHAAGGLPRDRLRLDRRRCGELPALDPSHVRDGPERGRAGRRVGRELSDRDTDRPANFRVDRDLLAGAHQDQCADAVPARLLFHLRARRADRRDGRGAAVRLARARLVLHRRAHALCADGRHGVPDLRGVLFLGAAVQRQPAVRARRALGVRAHVRRLQSRVFSDAPVRPARHAAARLHLSGRSRLERDQPAVDDRCLRVRRRRAGVCDRRAAHPAQTRVGQRQPVERGVARMAAAGQLCGAQHSAGDVGRSAVGPAEAAGAGHGRPALAARCAVRRARARWSRA